MTSLNLLMLNYEFPPLGGGGGHAHRCILEQFATMPELKVDVLTSQGEPGFKQESLAANVCLHKIGVHKKDLHYWRKSEVLEWLFKAAGPYRHLLRTEQYDLVHAFFAFPSGWFCYRSRKRLPYLVSLRGSDVPGYSQRLGLDYYLLNGLFRKIWSHAGAVVANSDGLRDLACKFTPDIAIDVIPNGIDTQLYYPQPNLIPNGPLRLLTVGRLIQRKRIDLLLEVVKNLQADKCDVHLTVAGDGNLAASLRQQARDWGIEPHVTFCGRVTTDKMPMLYRDHDLFLMSSTHEGMSNAMLEALASGLPIVTTRCEGVAELVDGNGWIVDDPLVASMTKAIRALVGDTPRRSQMSQAARQRAEDFSWHQVAQRYRAVYDQILRERTSHA